MRGACANAVVLTLIVAGCQSDRGGPGDFGGRLRDHGTLFVKVFNQDPAASGATDVQVSLDGSKILDRNFTQNAKSYDGQYQIRLPQGRHVLEASSEQSAVFVSRTIKLKDKAFIQIYIAPDKTARLTSGSRRSLVRLAIKRMRAARGINSDPALWMIIPAPQPSPSSRDAVKKHRQKTIQQDVRKNLGLKPAAPTAKPSLNTTQGNKR